MAVAPITTPFTCHDYAAEQDRRSRNAQTRIATLLGLAGTLIAVLALVVTAVKP